MKVFAPPWTMMLALGTKSSLLSNRRMLLSSVDDWEGCIMSTILLFVELYCKLALPFPPLQSLLSFFTESYFVVQAGLRLKLTLFKCTDQQILLSSQSCAVISFQNILNSPKKVCSSAVFIFLPTSCKQSPLIYGHLCPVSFIQHNERVYPCLFLFLRLLAMQFRRGLNTLCFYLSSLNVEIAFLSSRIIFCCVDIYHISLMDFQVSDSSLYE